MLSTISVVCFNVREGDVLYWFLDVQKECRILLTAVLFAIPLTAFSQEIRSDSLTVADLKREGVVFTGNNHVTLLTSGTMKFEDMFKAISQARKYVYLEYFNFRNDSIGNELFKLLEQKAREGVKVRIIYDDFGNISNDKPLRKRHLRHLNSKNIDVEVFDPVVFPWINHALHRDHRKIVVIDDRIVYAGGMNVADYYIHGRPEYGQWRDIHFRLEGDAVAVYRDIFCDMWHYSTGSEIDSVEYLVDESYRLSSFDNLRQDSLMTMDGVLLGVANRVPGKMSRVIRESYIDAIDNAQHKIQIINPYFTWVYSIKRAFYRALKRGVKVEIMLSTKCDVSLTPDVSAYNAKRLMERGADIYYYEDGFHHSKIMMVDSSFCTIGSANLNSRSLKFDHEVNAFIMDSLTTRKLQDMFEADKKSSTLLTPENWKKRRSLKRRFMGWLYHFLIPLI